VGKEQTHKMAAADKFRSEKAKCTYFLSVVYDNQKLDTKDS
jgi:hypothetical protein